MYHWDALSGNVSLSCSLPVFILVKYYIISFSWKKSRKQNITSSWSFLKHCCCVIWFPFISIFEKELAGGGAGAGSPSQLMFYSISSSLDARSMFNLSSSPSSVKGAVCKFHQEGGGGAFIYCPLSNHHHFPIFLANFVRLGNQFWWAVFIQTYLFSWDHIRSIIDLTNKDDGFPCGNASSERDKVDELGGALLCCSCNNTPYL